MSYPLRLLPFHARKPWAGDRLPGLFPALAHEMPPGTGECILLIDGPGQSSRIANGEWRGLGLDDLMRDHRSELMGELTNEGPGDFPLSVKLLDTSDMLSVQGHPLDHREHGRLVSRGKSECWIVLRAEPDAVIYQGLREGITADEFQDALDEPQGPLHLMNARAVQAGDFLYNEAGMVHAIGGGLTLLEAQQNCHVTWRLWDPPRPGPAREIHRREGLRDARWDLPAPAIQPAEGELAPRGPFGLRCATMEQPFQETRHWQGFTVHVCLEGSCEATGKDDDKLQPAVMKPGDLVLWPAGFREFEYYPQGRCRLVTAWSRE